MVRNEGLRGVTIIGTALLLAVLVAVLVLWGARPAEGAFPGDNGRITFTSNRDDGTSQEIYVMDADGDNETRLTDNAVSNHNPTFAPNGTKIAFDSPLGDPVNSGDDIYVMSATDTNLDGNGDNMKRLTKKPAEDEEPAFSPSGTKIAFTSDRIDPGGDNYEIYVMKAKPEGRRNRPKNLTKNAAYDAEASFSPDGTRIVFTSYRDDDDGDIYVMNSDGTGITRLTDDPAFDADANFSPDGTKIVFRSGRNIDPATNEPDPSEVYVMDAVDSDNDGEGDNMTNISNYPTDNDGFPAFSPDGTKIVFRSFRDGDYEVFVVNANDGSGLVQLTNNDDSDNTPDWGPLP